MNNHQPPKYLLRFLRWFCHPDYVEDIEGDLLERYEYKLNEKGLSRAKWTFINELLKLLRPGLMRPLFGSNKLNHTGMFKNYFKTGYRNLLRNKPNALINIGGLAIGIMVFMLISLWIVDEYSFDKSHTAHEKIAMVLKKRTINGETGVRFALPIPIVEELRTNYGEDFKHVTVTGWQGPYLIDTEEKQLNVVGNYMSPNAPKLLDLEMISGTQNSLSDDFSIILSENAAKALYDGENPIGKQVSIDGEVRMMVTGTYKDLPKHSSFYGLAFIANYDGYESTQEWMVRAKKNSYWDTNFCRVFVQLNDHATFSSTNQKIERVLYDHMNERGRANDPKVFLHPMEDWHLRSHWENGVQAGGPIQYVWLFGAIGIFVLLLACINFMNLSTAQAERRAKEVGIRKSLGSLRSHLIWQFLIESTLVVLLAFAVSLILITTVLPFFNQLADKEISLPITDAYFWLASVLFVLVVSVIAASYPAFYLSGFRPAKVIKGTFTPGKASGNLRRGLVVMQFVITTILVTATLIIYQQINHTKDRSIGYEPTNLLRIRSSVASFEGKHDILKDALMKTGLVASMSQSSSPLTEVNRSFSGFNWQGKDPELETNFVFSYVTPEFGETVKWRIKSGADFSGTKSDERSFIFNQAAIDFMNMEDPIGKNVEWKGESYRIIGVVEDIIIESPFDMTKPAVYTVDLSELEWMQVRPVANVSFSKALEAIENVFREFMPDVPFEFDLIGQKHEQKFSSIERVGDLSGIFAVLAILISALGLIGLVSYVAERKTKEIGIRKVLGASVRSIIWLLSSEFGKLVMIATTIAVPLSYYFTEQWLQGFAYRINLEWWYFFIAGAIVLLIATMTVGRKTIQAATSNPVNSLRDE